MYRIPGVLSAATTPAPGVPPVQPTRGPPPAPEDGSATGSAETIPGQAEDRERIAVVLNDIVVGRLLAAGLDLQGALGLLGDHPASGRIRHATEELDQAIRDIRDAISGARDTA
jgi:signal transduction histidine kinase